MTRKSDAEESIIKLEAELVNLRRVIVEESDPTISQIKEILMVFGNYPQLTVNKHGDKVEIKFAPQVWGHTFPKNIFGKTGLIIVGGKREDGFTYLYLQKP